MAEQIFHGGRLDQAKGEFGDGDWLDLSTGINPHCYPVGEVSSDAWQRLPSQSFMDGLLAVARRTYQVASGDGIIAANGTQALIELVPRLVQARQVAIFGPTYQEHGYTWKKAGVGVLDPADGPALPDHVDCAVIVNPNNPDGRIFIHEEMHELAKQLAERNGMLIIDEAFADAFDDVSIIEQRPENCIVLRSFGKFYGLAGLRLGFAIGSKSFCQMADSMMGPWAVSGPAIEIGARALGDESWAAQMRATLKQQSDLQADALGKAGLKVIASNPLFTYCEHEKAAHIHRELCKRQILVRPFADMPDKLRVGICSDAAALKRLGGALKEIIANVG